MANLDLLEPIVVGLAKGILHVVDTADHEFEVLKRRKTEEIISELARIASEWIRKIIG